MELFVIPTHRRCIQAIESLIKEIKLCKVADEQKALAIICNGDDKIEKDLLEYLCQRKKDLNFKIYLINKNDMIKISHKLAENLGKKQSEMDALLIPDRIDYGKIYNMIYIVSFILEAEVVHRRDSDCYFFEYQEASEFSINYEERFVKKKINSVMKEQGLTVVDEVIFSDCEEILIVGSDYVGNWNIDLHELMNANGEVAKKLLEICGIPEDSIDDQVNANYSNKCISNSNEAILKSSFKVPNAPECGNMCMYQAHRYIPNFIGENGIGFDYFTYFLCFLFGVPIVFHQNRINHIHDSKRYEDIDFYQYWLGIIKMVDFDLIYTSFIKNNYVESLMENKRGLEEIKKIVSHEFPLALEEIVNGISEEIRIEKFNSVAKEILINSNIEKYVHIGEQLLNEREEILESIRDDYKKSIRLQYIWDKVVVASEQLEFSKDKWEIE